MLLHESLIQIIKKRWRLLLSIGIVFVILTLIASLLLPLEYRADAQVLVIAESRFGVDPYTVVKTAERTAESLQEVVGSNDFYNKVMENPFYSLDKEKFKNISERKKRKVWQESVKTMAVYGTGLLNISAYHTDKEQAKNYAAAVTDTLIRNATDYTGGDLNIKILNEAVSTNYPVRPNIIFNVVLAFVVGFMASLFAVYRKS